MIENDFVSFYREVKDVFEDKNSWGKRIKLILGRGLEGEKGKYWGIIELGGI